MNANLMTKKIEMSQKEAKEAGKLNTEKFNELRNYMAMYPGLDINRIEGSIMRKSFGTQPWMLPMPVMIVAAYDENGIPNELR